MTKLFTSPERDSFHVQSYYETIQTETDPEKIEAAQGMVEYYTSYAERRRKKEEEVEWQQNNLEYDLRSSPYIKQKCTAENYAQNLYAAMCNNEFIKNTTWQILKDETWSCSWRYAGGIIADIREEGDYIDWYCSGIVGISDDDFNKMDEEAQKRYTWVKDNFVSESTVTDEIRADLFSLGWIVKEDTVE